MAAGNSQREFEIMPEDRPRGWRPLIIGITGESSSGKTYTALRLAAGIQRVLGGHIHGVDTEAGRMRHYEEYFRFRYIPFTPPHGPKDYIAVINHCVSAGAKIVVIDSMTHEHSGDGGVLDQIEAYLDLKAVDDNGNPDLGKRKRLGQVAHIEPKRARKKLNQRIVALGEVVFLLCYQAGEKLNFKKKQQPAGDQRQQQGKRFEKRDNEPESLGFQPDTTSRLHFNMTLRFLLKPGCEGRPTLQPEIPAEQMLVKLPRQFQEWFKPGEQLTEEHGERLARWASGKESAVKALVAGATAPTVAEYDQSDGPTYKLLEGRRKETYGAQSTQLRADLEAAKKRAFDRLSAQASKPATSAASLPAEEPAETWDIPSACSALRECGDEAALEDLYARIDSFFGGAPMEIEACRDTCREQLRQL